MTKITVPDLLDAYDYLRDKCRKAGPWDHQIGIKEWLERAVIVNSLYVFRPKKRIQAVMFGWPTDKLEEEREEPQYKEDGDIFYVKFYHGAGEQASVQRWVGGMALERHPLVTKFCFSEYSENGEKTSRLLELAEETVNG